MSECQVVTRAVESVEMLSNVARRSSRQKEKESGEWDPPKGMKPETRLIRRRRQENRGEEEHLGITSPKVMLFIPLKSQCHASDGRQTFSREEGKNDKLAFVRQPQCGCMANGGYLCQTC